MKEQFASLIDVKTIVTFVITAVFAYLAATGKMEVKDFMIIAIMIYTYFFTKKPTPDSSVTTTTTKTITPNPENEDSKV